MIVWTDPWKKNTSSFKSMINLQNQSRTVNTDLDVQLVNPDGQIGVGVEVEVVHSLLHTVEDLGESLLLVHAGLQRTHLKVNFLFNQEQVIHLSSGVGKGNKMRK